MDSTAKPEELSKDNPPPAPVVEHLARVVLLAFLFTFIASRVLVILIMTRRMPDLFMHMGGTHVHHLNYGIFLLSGVGMYLLFRRPSGKHLDWAALAYGVGLALTFDEFGMWLHLGGGYWQRASYDAVTVIAALLGLFAYAPAFNKFKTVHWAWGMLSALAVLVFTGMLLISLGHYLKRYAPFLERLEQSGPQ